MPMYDFLDKNTKEVFEKKVALADLDQFMKDNPHLERYLGNQATAFCYGTTVRNRDGGFKEVLQKIHERTAGSNLNTIADI